MDILKFKNKDIDKRINYILSSIGFKKNKKGIHTKSINDYVEIFLIIEKTDRRTGNTLYLNPIVGIVDQNVENLYQELVTDIDNSKGIVNTATVSLGYLTPENKYIAWTIPVHYSEDETQKVIDNLFSTFETHAIPYMETLKERDKLLRALQTNKLGLQKINQFKIPILYYLMGLKDKGVEYAKKVLHHEKPTPKNSEIPEPEFTAYSEALDYFRQDKDVRFYYSYSRFLNNFKDL